MLLLTFQHREIDLIRIITELVVNYPFITKIDGHIILQLNSGKRTSMR